MFQRKDIVERGILFIEPWEKAKTNKTLIFLDCLLKYIEVNTFVLPHIKRINYRYSLEIYSQDFEISKILKKNKFKLFQENIYLSEDSKDLKIFSIYFALNWYKLFTNKYSFYYLDVDLGVALQQEILNLVYTFLENVEFYRTICDEDLLDFIYVENPMSCTGRSLQYICNARKIKYLNIFPLFYGSFKNRITKKIAYKREMMDITGLYYIGKKERDPTYINMNILIIAPYINYLTAIFPVIKVLLDKKYNIFLIAKKRDLSNFNFDFQEVKLNVPSYYRKPDFYFNKEILELDVQKSNNIVKYNEINVFEALKDDFYYIFKDKCNKLRSNLDWFSEIISLADPDLVLVGDDRGPSFVRAQLLYCKKKEIPIIEIQHGIYTANRPIAPPISDKICVWGDFAKRALLKYGATSEQIVVTGSPKLDAFYQEVKSHSISYVNRSKLILLFVTQPIYENLNFKVIEEIGNILQNRDDVTLIIKPHPSETIGTYVSMANKLRSNVFVKDPSESIDELIISCDLMIAMSSTAVINAAIAGKKIITLNIGGTSDNPYKEISVEVTKLDKLCIAVESLLDKSIEEVLCLRNKFVYEHTYIQDGKASERVTDLIIDMLENKK